MLTELLTSADLLHSSCVLLLALSSGVSSPSAAPLLPAWPVFPSVFLPEFQTFHCKTRTIFFSCTSNFNSNQNRIKCQHRKLEKNCAINTVPANPNRPKLTYLLSSASVAPSAAPPSFPAAHEVSFPSPAASSHDSPSPEKNSNFHYRKL